MPRLGSACAAAVVLIATATPLSQAAARGGYTARPPTPVCGWSGGALSDPAVTQACLARRFAKPPPTTTPTEAHSSGAGAQAPTGR
ncbi:MAG TPA: hypothetical protein VKT30_03475 [Caulobacteraceae bacterium]|nr:hypothetical protein [Caulobacteraceae bacterium]